MEKLVFLEFKRGKQKLLINKAIQKAGSEKRLVGLINIPSASIYSYKNEIYPLPVERVKRLAEFLGLNFSKIKNQAVKLTNRGWDKNEINFLKENYLDMTAKEIASKLNKSIDSIKHTRRKLNLKKGAAYRWRKDKVISSFNNFVKKLGKTPTYQECAKKYPGMLTSIHRNWGRYSKFLGYLSLNTKTKRWTKEDCIKEFKRLRKKTNAIPTIKDLKQSSGLFKAIIRRWKFYNNFLRELGHNPNFELKWNKEKCLEEFSKIMISRKNVLTIEELLKVKPSLVAAIYKYFKNYPSFLRIAGYKYDDKWQKWENLVIKICKKIYSNVKIKPKLKNNKQPDIVITKNGSFDKIIDAKLNSFTNSIGTDIKKYKPYCKKLEFWCLIGEKKLWTKDIKIINPNKIKRVLKQKNELNLVNEVEIMEKICC